MVTRDMKGPSRLIAFIASAAFLLSCGCGSKQQPAPVDETKDARVETRAEEDESASSMKQAAAALTRALGDDSPKVRCAAVKSMALLDPEAAAGANAIEPLMGLLRDPDVKTEYSLTAIDKAGATDSDILKLLEDDDRKVRVSALLLIAKKGPDGASMLPSLTALLQDPETIKDLSFRFVIVKALMLIGKDALPVLMTLLDDDSAAVREVTVNSIGNMEPPAAGAVAGLLKALDDPQVEVRAAAARALGKIGKAEEKPPKELLGGLLKALEDKNMGVRVAAADGLAMLGPDAAPAAAALVKAMDDKEIFVIDYGSFKIKSHPVRQAAAKALGAMGPEAKDAIPLLIRDIKTLEEPLFFESMEALGKIGEPAVGELVKVLKSKNSKAHDRALQALASMGPAAKDAAPVLAKMVKKGHPLAAQALGNIGPDAARAAAALIGAVKKEVKKKEDTEMALAAMRALGEIGPQAKKAVPVLLEALWYDQPVESSTPKAALEAIRKIDPDAELPVDKLRKALDDKDWNMRIHAVKVLGLMAGQGEDVTTDLIKALDDEHCNVNRQAAVELGALGPDAAPAAPALGKILDGDCFRAAEKAAWALGKIGPAAKDALPALMKAAESDKLLVRSEAAPAAVKVAALGEAEAEVFLESLLIDETALDGSVVDALATIGEPALPVLRKGLKSKSLKIRKYSAFSLGRMGEPAAEALPDLIDMLAEDKDAAARQAAAWAMGMLLADKEYGEANKTEWYLF